MANDTDWVEDVKRWYLNGTRPLASIAADSAGDDSASSDYGAELGYEAAHPTLQAPHWPDAVDLSTDR